MKKIRLFLTGLLLMVGCAAFAQNISVKGTVTDAETGEPVVGAAVVLQSNNANYAITDVSGNYSIKAPKGDVLNVSFLGYVKQSVAIEGRTEINIILTPEATDLDEVLVVAYGTSKKSSFTGSAAQVKGEDIQKQQVSDISNALEGMTAGLQTASSSGTPGSGSSIIIRGLGSISASQQPLIVVDGVPYEGSLNSISSQDIESLTVLKDAAANSLYGARGSNGVILITTKQAKAGKTQVSFDARYGFNTRGVPSYNVIENTGDYYEMMYESIANSLYESGEFNRYGANLYASEHLIDEYLKYNVYTDVDDDKIIDPNTGKLSYWAGTKKWSDNWNKDVFSNGPRQQYNVNVSGGTETTKAYASLEYLSDEGYVKNSGFNRFSGRAKVDQNIGKIFKLGANIAYSRTEQKLFGDESSNYSNIFMFSQSIAPIYPIYLYDEDGNIQKDANGTVLYDYGTEWNRPYAMEQNPYATIVADKNNSVVDNLTTRAYLDINILKDLKFTANVAYDVFNNTQTNYQTPIGGDAKNVGGRGYKYATRYQALNANQLINYTPKFGDHSINFLLGHETKHDNYNYLYGQMTNFVDVNNTEFANATLYQDLSSYTSEYSLEGYFTRLEYNFAERYYISGSFRMDGSSRFSPENRWGKFWSVGASWRINEENWMQSVDAINNLRLKASYGTQGNDNIGVSKVYLDLYTISRVDGEAGVTKTFRGNPDVTWEKSQNFNVGLDLGLWNRLNLTAEYFIKETKDMIYYRPLAASEGNPSSIIVNDIDMRNNGIEFEISGDIIKTKNVTWNLAINGTHYKNQLTKLPSDKDPNGYQAGSYWRKVGGSLYDWYTYEYAGVDKETGLPLYNKYTKDANGNEVVTQVNKTSEATLRETGKNPIPDLYGGISTSLSLYGVDLSIATAYQLGGWVWDSYYQSLMNPGAAGENMHTDMYNRWTPTNTDTNVPRLCYQDQDANSSSDRWLTSASYFSLKNVTVGYTFPKKWMSKIKVEKLRIYLTGDNLWLKSARQGFDPRQSFSGSTGYNYSALATYSAGLNIVF